MQISQLAGLYVNHRTQHNSLCRHKYKHYVTSYVIVYKAMCHVTLSRMRELSPTLTIFAWNNTFRIALVLTHIGQGSNSINIIAKLFTESIQNCIRSVRLKPFLLRESSKTDDERDAGLACTPSYQPVLQEVTTVYDIFSQAHPRRPPIKLFISPDGFS